MLVVARNLEQEIQIGRAIRVKVVRLSRSRAWLGVSAPGALPVCRSEIRHQMQRAPRFLIVEPDKAHARQVEQVLRSADRALIRHATNCEGASRALIGCSKTKFRPDAILLNSNLPDATQAEALQHLQTCRTARHVPIVILSGTPVDLNTARCLAIGADALVTGHSGQSPRRPTANRPPHGALPRNPAGRRAEALAIIQGNTVTRVR